MNLFESGIRPAIDNHLLELSKEERDYGKYWSASSAGKCYRHQVFARLGLPYAPEPEANKPVRQRTFSVGHIFHEWIQAITKEAGLSIAQELELQNEDLLIRGHIDDLVLVIYDENGETPVRVGAEQRAQHLILYDYKTVHSDYFHYAKEKIGDYHRLQLGTYMYMLRKGAKDWESRLILLGGGETAKGRTRLKEQLLNLTEARRLNISKDDLRMSENQLLWSDGLEEDVVDYWKGLNDVWEKRKIPPCTCGKLDGGFMSRRSKKGKIFNDYFYNDEPCSLSWYEECKKKGLIPQGNEGEK